MLRRHIGIPKDFIKKASLILIVNLMKMIPTWLGFYMNKQLRFIILLLLLIVPGIRALHAQTAFASEDELKQQALKLFEDDEFEEAYPLYSQLVSLYPKDANYNYRLGVCMIYASDDKEKPIPFLEYAAKKPEVEKEVLFYLAKAYHLNYRFDDAIAEYLAYEKVASEAKANKLQVDRQIEMCKNGKKLLRNITDLVVIDKKELSRADFYRAYDISDIGGKLLAKPDEEAFKTSLDKKKKEKSIIYLASNNNQVFFSSYGDDAEHGKDIYIIRKLPNGEWSKPQTLGYPVNTEYDEDYPFLHPNGKVLYFCSKGHNSMGGYDIFKTTLNEETNTWNKPVNLDFPINTPDDDILYVTNEDEKEAYFSSARSSKTGKTAVFHINVERKPIDIAIIKGMVIKTKDNQALDVKITVKDLGDNTILGIYNAKETGSYLINLPNGGRFMYTVEAAGFNTQSEVVVLPTQYEFKPLKQEISYEPGTDKLIVKNMFDEPEDDQSYLSVLNFIKEKSKMEANVDALNAAAAKSNTGAADDNTATKTTDNSTKAVGDNTKTADNSKTAGNASKTNSTPANLSNDAIVKIAYDDAKDAEKEAKDLQEQADIALNLANQKNELAQNKTKEAAQLMSDANNMTDNMKKQTAMDDAKQARTESEELNQETVAAFNIAKKLQQKAAAKDEEADLSLQYAKDLDAAGKSKNPTEALAKLEEQEKKLEELSEKNGNAEPDNIYSGLKMDADTKKRELDKATQASSDIKQEIADNETLMTSLQADADKTKKEDLKQGLLDQIAGLKADNEQNKKDLEANDQKIAKVQKDLNGIKNEMDLVSNVVDKAKTETNENAAASVASIDKAQLEKQVNELKASSDAAVASTTNKTSSKTSADDNSSKTNAADTKAGNEIVSNSAENKTGSDAASDKTPDNSTASDKTNDTKSADNTITETKPDYTKQYTDQLAAADNIASPLERENKKAELYKNWTSSITDELNQKKQDVKSEKDKTKKKELNTEIVALEKELKSKQEEEQTAVASVEKIKKQDAAVADNTSSDNTKTADNTKSTDNSAVTPGNSTPDNSSAANTTVSIGSINETYSNKLADAEKITNELDRETAKSTALKEWSAAINSNIEKQKQDMAASTDPEMKALLAKKINDAQTLLKDKQALADASTKKAADLKQQQGGIASNSDAAKSADKTTDNKTTNDQGKTNDASKSTDIAANDSKTSPDNSTSKTNDQAKSTDAATDSKTGNDAAKSNDIAANDAKTNPDNATDKTTNDATNTGSDPVQKLESAVAYAEKAGTEKEREEKKAQAYRYYVADVNDQITAKQNELKSEKDKTKKKELNKEIAALQSDVKEKQKLADDSEAKAKALESGAIASNDTKSTDAGTTTPVDNTATNSAAGNNEDDTNTSLVKNEMPIVYTDKVAIEKSKDAVTANKEADDLVTQANDLKSQAAEKSNPSEKDALITQANDLMVQADVKKIKAAQLSSDANKSEFLGNQDVLNQLATASVNNKSDDVAMAEMMKDESNLYFDKAQKSREMASSVSSDADKLAALEDAGANEKIALEKQKKATELYKKNNPGFVAVVKNTDAGKTNPDNSKTTDASKSNDLAANNSKTNPDNSTSKTSDQAKSTDAATDSKTGNDASKSTDIAANDSKTNPDNSTSKTSDQAKSTDAATDSKTGNDASKSNDIAANDSKTNPDNSTSKTSDQVKSTDAATDSKTGNDASKSNDIAANDSKTNPDNSSSKTNDQAKSTDAATDSKTGNDASKSNDIAANDSKTNPDNSTSKTNDQAKSTDAAIDSKTGNDAAKSNDIAANDSNNNPDNSTSKTNDAAKSADATNTNPALNNGAATNGTTKTKTVLAPEEKFERTTQPVYSASKPIPVNEKLPEGLVYKVQIGAFRNPISPEQFKGMSPITAETTSQGFTRYTAGFFTKFATADNVKNEIRELGYKDAFVVVFLNGKRISVAEALKLQGESPAIIAANTASNKAPDNTASSPDNSSTATTPAVKKTNPPVNTSAPAVAENVAVVSGLFYTVQVGVYSQPVSSSKLYNIQPLYAENTPNGNIRYNTGIYNSVQKANEARSAVVGAGVKDAFVTAYYQGKRISLTEAKNIEAQGSGVFSSSPAMNQMPSTSGTARNIPVNKPTATEPKVNPVSAEPKNTPPETQPVTNTQVPVGNTELKNTIQQNNSAPADTGLVFKVQIGAFKDEVPLEIANQFLKLAGKGIKNYRDNNGLTIYTLGSFKTYEEASALRTEIAPVVKDAFIVAYNNGKKISVDEAKTLQTK